MVMKFPRRRPHRVEPLEWVVLNGRRHILVENLPPGPLCGGWSPPDAAGDADSPDADPPECEACWAQMEFLRWA